MKMRIGAKLLITNLFVMTIAGSLLTANQARAWTAEGFKKPADSELKKKLTKIQ